MRFLELIFSYELHYPGINFLPWTKDNMVEKTKAQRELNKPWILSYD